jgi:hypothetical protein
VLLLALELAKNIQYLPPSIRYTQIMGILKH